MCVEWNVVCRVCRWLVCFVWLFFLVIVCVSVVNVMFMCFSFVCS